MRSRSVLSTLAAALLCALALISCSSGDDSDPAQTKATTTTTTKAATVLLTGGEAAVASAGADVAIDEATKQAVLDASQTYVDAAVLAPLMDGAVGAGYDALFDAGVSPTATGVDRAALTDEGITPVTASPTVTATPVRFDGLADANGALLLVATTFTLDVTGTTDTGPLVIHRTNELTFTPGPNGGWLITAYRVGVTRGTVAGTTSTTVGGTAVIRRLAISFVVLTTLVVAAAGGLTAAWLAGIRVPIASGATYMEIQKLAGADAAGAPNNMFFIALVGSDFRPGVGGARGDALHLVGVNPATHIATMLNVPRDTCWQGGKINRAHAQGGPRGMANALGDLTGVPVSYVVSVDFAGFQGIVDGMGGVQVNVPVAMDDEYSGAVFAPGDQRLNGQQALAFSRDRHDFPNSDISRTGNQGLLILSALGQLQREARGPIGEFKAAALIGRHAQVDGMSLTDVYRLGRIAQQLNPAAARSVTIPVGGGSCLPLVGDARGLLADFADDATLQAH